MPKYSLEGDVTQYAEYFRSARRREKNRLERNLANVPRWQQLLAKAKDDTPERLLTERLAKLSSLMKENGLTVAKKTGFSYGKSYNTSYKKGEVEIKNLTSEISIAPTGTVSVDVYRVPEKDKDAYYYRPRAADKVIRIFIGEETRITNNVLRTLVNKT
jgi:hypothetical protein